MMTVLTYSLNPSFDRGIVHKFLTVVCLQNELVIELGKGNPGIAIEFGWVYRELARGPVVRTR